MAMHGVRDVVPPLAKAVLFVLRHLDEKPLLLDDVVRMLFLADYVTHKLLGVRICDVKWRKGGIEIVNSLAIRRALARLVRMGYLDKEVVNGKAIVKLRTSVSVEELRGLRFVQYLYGWDEVRRKRVSATRDMIQSLETILRKICGIENLRLRYSISILPEHRYVDYGNVIEFLPHPQIEKLLVVMRLRELVRTDIKIMAMKLGVAIDIKDIEGIELCIHPRASNTEIENALERIRKLIEEGVLPAHPLWETYIEIKHRYRLANELEAILKELSLLLEIDLSKPWSIYILYTRF